METLHPGHTICRAELLAVCSDIQSSSGHLPGYIPDEDPDDGSLFCCLTTKKALRHEMAFSPLASDRSWHCSAANSRDKVNEGLHGCRQRTRIQRPPYEPSQRLWRGYSSMFHFRPCGGLL